MNRGEKIFAKLLDKLGKTYIPQPKKFKLKPPLNSYRTDFYVPKENTYYEVSTTRQAFYGNRLKYEALRKEHPKVKFKIVNPDGTKFIHYSKKKTNCKCRKCGYKWHSAKHELKATHYDRFKAVYPENHKEWWPTECPECKQRKWR